MTFVFRGPADAVFLQHWIYGLPSAQPFQRIDGSDLWYLVQEIPPRSRVEYKLEVQQGDLHRLIRDPLNPQLAHDPFGANSVCHGADYVEPEWVTADPEARPGPDRGSAGAGARAGRAAAGVDLPAGALPRRPRAIRCSSCTTAATTCASPPLRRVLDNLIHRIEVAPMIVALIAVAVPAARVRRRPAARPLAGRRSWCPALEGRYPLRSGAASRGLAGRELRRGGGVRDRGAPPGDSSAASCCSRARSPSPTSAPPAAGRRSSRSSSSSTPSASGRRRRPSRRSSPAASTSR